jgi:hypothetical protein
MILAEHWNLILYAIAWGGLAGVAAVYPVWQKGHALQSLRFFSVLMIALSASAVAWVWLATRVAMRGQLLRSLRND